jgi:hypothetical protein
MIAKGNAKEPLRNSGNYAIIVFKFEGEESGTIKMKSK